MGLIGYMLITIAAYMGMGLVFGLVFVVRGIGVVDPAAEHASWACRVLILPGTAALWPVMLQKWVAARGGGE
jgi:hypothetical protein